MSDYVSLFFLVEGVLFADGVLTVGLQSGKAVFWLFVLGVECRPFACTQYILPVGQCVS